MCTLDATLAVYVRGTMVGRELTRSCDFCEVVFCISSNLNIISERSIIKEDHHILIQITILNHYTQRGPFHIVFTIYSNITSKEDHYTLDSTYPQTSYPKRTTTYQMQDLLVHHIQKIDHHTLYARISSHIASK